MTSRTGRKISLRKSSGRSPVHVPDEALDAGAVRKTLCRCLGEYESTWGPRFRATLAGQETVPLVRIDPDTVVERDQSYQRIGWTQGTEECMTYEIRPIGVVESPLGRSRERSQAGCGGWSPGLADEVFVLTWLHLADRSVLAVHPRDDPRTPDRCLQHPFLRPAQSHRSAPSSGARDRRARVRVADLEAVNGTPIVDVKPVLGTTR